MVTRRFSSMLVVVALLFGALAGTASAAPSQSCVSYHVVQPGENLFRIGLQYGLTTDVLMQANGIFNPNLIYVGQSLCIPGNTAPNPNPQPQPQPQPQPHPQPGTGAGFYYTVKWGDTLNTIAQRYGVSIFRIIYANNITNANLLYAGTVLWIPGVNPAAPGTSYPQWRGEYFNNATLDGQPSLVRNDPQINFNWGAGWPTSKVSADAYSVRWTRSLYFGTATFEFTAAADNGLRLYVDNVLTIDQWTQTGGAAFTADVALGAGYHTLRMEMFKSSGNGSVYLNWTRTTTPAGTPIPGATATPVSGGPSGIWTGYYFANQDLGGLAFTRLDPSINFNWGTNSPGPGIGKNLWSARWISTQQFNTGLYQFNAIVDDGVRIYVDDQIVVNEWSNHAGTTVAGTVNLTAGVHTVKVEYYQFGHEALITVWWNQIQ